MTGENEYLISSDGQMYPLSYFGAIVTGLGNVPVEYRTRESYGQHSVTVDGFKLTPRTISFSFPLHGRSRQALWDRRQRLIEVLNPEKGVVTYRHVMPDGSRRDIDGWLDASLSLAESEDGRGNSVGFSLFCPDPTFYDPQAQSENVAAVEVTALILPFYLPDELWFGGGTTLVATVNNPGTWRAYPVLTITGPYQRLVCSNETTGATFTLGVALDIGETLVVDLTPGQQRVTRGGVNALDEIESGNIVDWLLAPGDNVLSFSGAGLTDVSQVNVSFQARYVAL